MKLQDCKIGTVVCTIDNNGSVEAIGVIVGITNNCSYGDLDVRKEPRRAVPLVQFSCDLSPRPIHNGNIFPFKDSYLKGE